MKNSIIVHNLDREELRELLKAVIKEELNELVASIKSSQFEELLTREETCKLLKIDSSTLWSWTNKGKLICYGIGNRRYYKRSEILEALVLKK